MSILKNKPAIKRIAIVATDNKRADLIEWSYFNKDILIQHQLTATGETAIVLEGTLNSKINTLFTADSGGCRQLASLMEKGEIDMLFFFAEPATSVEKDMDLKNVLLVAAKHNLMVASNKITTDMVMASVFPVKEESVQRKKYTGFLKQTISLIGELTSKRFMTTG